MKQSAKFFLFIALLFFFLIGSFFLFINFPIGDSWDFRNNLWGPAYLLTNKQDPYDIKLLFPESNAVWLPPAVGFFFFMGMLPFDIARVIWLILSLIAFFIACLIMIQPVKSPKEFIWFVLIALFPSTIINFTMGQFSIIGLFLLLILSKAYNQIPQWIIGFILVLLLTKPQIIIFSTPVFLFSFMKEKGVKATVNLIVWIIIWMLVSFLPFFIISNKWIFQLVNNLKENGRWLQPNLYSLFVQQLGITPLLSIFVVFIGFWICIEYSTKHNIYDSTILSMAITTIFSPYIWSWDFVFLFPLLINSYKINDSKFIKSIILLGYSAITVIYNILKIIGYNSDELFIWVSPAIITLILLAEVIKKKINPIFEWLL